MKKVSCNSRITEIDTLVSTILRQYEANAALAKDAFLKEMMAELAPLSRQLTEAIKRDRVSSGLADADGVRDAVIMDLGTLLEGYTAIPFEDQKAAANAVKAVFDKYGKRIANESFARESSLIESLLIDLNAPVLSGASNWPPMARMSVMALPMAGVGTVSRKLYQGSKSTDCACIRPWRTAR